LALAHPAISTPTTEMLDHQARAGGDDEEDQEGGDHHDRRRQREDSPVRLVRHDVLLLEELDAVAHELEPAVEAAGIHRTEPALHVAHHLEQERVPEDERAEGNDHQHDHGLDREGGSPADFEREDGVHYDAPLRGARQAASPWLRSA